MQDGIVLKRDKCVWPTPQDAVFWFVLHRVIKPWQFSKLTLKIKQAGSYLRKVGLALYVLGLTGPFFLHCGSSPYCL